MSTPTTMTIAKTYVVCPKCGKPAGTVDHLRGYEHDLMWYCEHCGCRYAFSLTEDGTVTAVVDTGERTDKTVVLLKAGDIVLVVEGTLHTPGDSSHDAYFYNTHTCPTNYLKSVKAIIDLKNKDTDPHGIFEYVATLPWNAQADECNNGDYLQTLFPYFIDNPDQQSLCE